MWLAIPQLFSQSFQLEGTYLNFHQPISAVLRCQTPYSSDPEYCELNSVNKRTVKTLSSDNGLLSASPGLRPLFLESYEACVTRRILTNTPLEFSRKLAERLFTDINGAWEEKLSDRLRRGFRLATERNPKEEELQSWISFTTENLERFSAAHDNAEKFPSYGETPRNKDLPTPQVAVLSFTMSTVLNLDETITRE